MTAPVTPNPAVTLRAANLRVGYGKLALLPPITFDVGAGEMWAIAGPNGSGKTTLVRTLLGLIPALGGSVTPPARMGYVPQRSRLDGRSPGRVVDVVRAGLDEGWSFLRPRALSGGGEAVERALSLTSCTSLRDHRYAALSEGQKQRVLLARALVRSPQLLVLDEPTSAMDAAAEHRVMQLIDDVRAQTGVGVLVISHHLGVVARFATHLIVLDRDAQTVRCGRREEVGADPDVQRRYGRLFVQAPAADADDVALHAAPRGALTGEHEAAGSDARSEGGAP